MGKATLPLIPPLTASVTQEYYLQIPLCERGTNFVNPSRFPSRCIFNETFIELTVRGISTKFCASVSTYNPHPRSSSLPQHETTLVLETKKKFKEEPKVVKLNKEEVAEWDVDRVAEWLTENHLDTYIEGFEEQSMDGAALWAVEEEHFPSLGITKLGDVLKMKEALKMFDK